MIDTCVCHNQIRNVEKTIQIVKPSNHCYLIVAGYLSLRLIWSRAGRLFRAERLHHPILVPKERWNGKSRHITQEPAPVPCHTNRVHRLREESELSYKWETTIDAKAAGWTQQERLVWSPKTTGLEFLVIFIVNDHNSISEQHRTSTWAQDTIVANAQGMATIYIALLQLITIIDTTVQDLRQLFYSNDNSDRWDNCKSLKIMIPTTTTH